MKSKSIILIISFLLLGACKENKQVQLEPKNQEVREIKSTQQTKKKLFNHKCFHPKLSEVAEMTEVHIGDNVIFDFRFSTSDRGDKIIKVIKDGSEVQEMVVNGTFENKQGLIDWNFDGYKDLTVLHNSGSGGLIYKIWNFNSTLGEFIYNERISQLIGLEIDTLNQQNIFHYREGSNHEFISYYKYRNDSLKFVKNIDKQFMRYDGNEWKVVTTSIVRNDTIRRSKDSLQFE